eukprot:CAMPEP_0201617262 /NCGR_PEP_ID=MMETSP0492-20130828/35870_1 /ASSEMBLY_ACC=CAM_ASM_000837 /TAXON_ID=420259 /ORGANISM="Thalassiosira gravida, Strain GMp14c1" /LENGTH=112 /DNA_ID=CAMNT_0048085457 /DNA_START=291 /DNA_END=625 /DNA_ORIENTATION=-
MYDVTYSFSRGQSFASANMSQSATDARVKVRDLTSVISTANLSPGTSRRLAASIRSDPVSLFMESGGDISPVDVAEDDAKYADFYIVDRNGFGVAVFVATLVVVSLAKIEEE